MTNTAFRLTCAALTDLGDADVTLPLAGAIAIVLALLRADLAWRWVVVVGGAFGVILTLKLVFGIVLALGASLGIRSPSGHTCSSSLVYGSLALLLTGRARLALGLASAIAGLIGFTRLALGAHSFPEVLLGGVVGVVAVAMLGRVVRSRPPLRPAHRVVLVPVAMVAVALFYGRMAGIEGRLDKLEYAADQALGLPSWQGERAYLKLYGG